MNFAEAFRPFACILLLAGAFAQPGAHQARQSTTPVPENLYRVHDARGRPAKLADVVEAMREADVVFVGETHDDATTHWIEAELLREAFARFGPGAPGASRRPLALSLEMFERDVQHVLDEYLADLISERYFLLSSRPWSNYLKDYRPMVEFARESGLPVLASNAPARYVNRVSRLGPASLRELPAQARAWLPPLPFAPASEAYAAKFAAVMSGTPGHPRPERPQVGAQPQSPHGPANPQGPESPHGDASHLLAAQTLRDASMAHVISEFLKKNPRALLFHVNGRFHSEGGLGVPEHLKVYRPKTRTLVVTLVPLANLSTAGPEEAGKLGDFVISTTTARPREF